MPSSTRLRRLRWLLFALLVVLTTFGTYEWGDHPPDWVTGPWFVLLVVLLGWKFLDHLRGPPPPQPPPTMPPSPPAA